MFTRFLRMDIAAHVEKPREEHFCPGSNSGKAELARVFGANLHGSSERKSVLT